MQKELILQNFQLLKHTENDVKLITVKAIKIFQVPYSEITGKQAGGIEAEKLAGFSKCVTNKTKNFTLLNYFLKPHSL